MGDILEALIEKLPPAYLMALIPILVILLLWAIPHIRRDKQGKWMWYSDIYEHRKQDKKIEQLLTSVTNTSMRILRLEILNAIHHTPEKVEVIMALYDEYKKVYKGNSYIDAVFEAWKQQYAAHIIQARVS